MMRDDLVGYLVGALDASEHDELKQRLDSDEKLRQQLKLVDRGLQPLRWDAGTQEPPADLAARTCDLIDRHVEDNKVERASGGAMSAAGREEWADRNRNWTMADFVVAAGVCLAAACLFFPALSSSRHHQRMVACQNKLRDVGLALTDYSMSDRQGMFPVIPAKGKMGVAGMYAPTLMDGGFVDNADVFYCPAKSNNTIVLKIPKINEVLSAEPEDLVSLYNNMGGDYAYNLGFVENGKLQGVRNRNRRFYPILADEPLELLADSVVTGHGRGQNLFFEDGHVEFVMTRTRPKLKSDDLFLNDHGLKQAGLHANDAVLGTSSVRPVPVGWQVPSSQ